MPGIITHKFRLNNATQFFESFTEAPNINTKYYMFLGRAHSWPNDVSPPTPQDTVLNSDFNVWRNMIATKRVTSSDLAFVVARNDWASGQVYTPYSDTNSSIYTSNFFVVTDDYNVYKCIDNNNGALSTIKPSSTSTSIVTTSDGYRWKFMYSISPADVLKFTTTNFIPVKELTSDDGSLQFDVQSAASNGAIHYIDVSSSGSGYLYATGNFANVDTSTTVKLTSASGADDVYVGSTIYINSGTGSGQLREIIDYQGNIGKATVNTAFSPVPTTGSSYIVGPKVTITGDGQNALAYANVALPALSSATVGNAVNEIIMINEGSNYSKFNVTISSNTSHGTGATGIGTVAPYGGHGSNPVKELGATDVLLNVRMIGAESGTFITNNDFRIVGLMNNPQLYSGAQANSTVYDMTTKFTVTSKTGTFSADEMILGSTSASSARFVSFANTNSSGSEGVISVTGLDGTFTTETITGNTSTQTAVISSINNRDLQDFKGDILYIENRLPVSRAADQTEDIKLIVRF